MNGLNMLQQWIYVKVIIIYLSMKRHKSSAQLYSLGESIVIKDSQWESDVFQKAMNDIFGDLDYVLVYLDGILISSKDNHAFPHLRSNHSVSRSQDHIYSTMVSSQATRLLVT